MQTSYVGAQPVAFGELKTCILLGNGGPTSYSPSTGDPVANPAAGDYIAAPEQAALSLSALYIVNFQPISVGDIRAGAPSASVSGWTAFYSYSGLGEITVAQNAAGSGMTPGNVAPLTFSAGNAAGYITVLTATTVKITITYNGTGYASGTLPTATATNTATGGTAPTFTVHAETASGFVPAATDLSGEQFQFKALVTER